MQNRLRNAARIIEAPAGGTALRLWHRPCLCRMTAAAAQRRHRRATARARSRRDPPGRHGATPSSFGFRDLLDIVNPLQHLPIISSIYRWLTGDRPGEAAEIAGDALYGGPIGVAFGLSAPPPRIARAATLASSVLAELVRLGRSQVRPPSRRRPPAATSRRNSCRRRGGNCRRIAGPGGAAARPCSRGGGGSSDPCRFSAARGVRRRCRPRLSPAATASTAAPNAARALINHNAALERTDRRRRPRRPAPCARAAGAAGRDAAFWRGGLVAAHRGPGRPDTRHAHRYFAENAGRARQVHAGSRSSSRRPPPTPGVDLAL